MGHYDIAQVCVNGHLVTHSYNQFSQGRQDFCESCGAETIHKCRACDKPIRGEYHVEGWFGVSDYSVPSFCLGCGKPYPWIAAKIHAAKALADELDGLSDAERISLKASIDDIAANTPMAEVAIVRIKKLIPKILQGGGEILRKLLVDIASEAAAKTLKGQ